MNPADKSTFTLEDLTWQEPFNEIYSRSIGQATRMGATLEEVHRFRSNGSSCSPDVVLGVDITLAAHFHDLLYHLGGTPYDRYVADQLFYRNLRRCGLPRLVAWVYYSRVRAWGYTHWTGGSKFSIGKTLKLIFTRYLEF